MNQVNISKATAHASSARTGTSVFTKSGTITDVKAFLDSLRVARADWQDTVYKVSNDALYGILAGCLRLYYHVWEEGADNTGTRRKELKKDLEEILKNRGIRFNENTHLATRIVRCVFETDRKRASVYSIVLRAAIDLDVKPEDLPQFIRDNKGIEEIRLSKGEKKVSQTDGKQNPFDLVREAKPLAFLPAGTVKEAVAANDELRVAIVACHVDGAVEVKWIGESKGALRLAATAYAKARNAEKPVVSSDSSKNGVLNAAMTKAA